MNNDNGFGFLIFILVVAGFLYIVLPLTTAVLAGGTLYYIAMRLYWINRYMPISRLYFPIIFTCVMGKLSYDFAIISMNRDDILGFLIAIPAVGLPIALHHLGLIIFSITPRKIEWIDNAHRLYEIGDITKKMRNISIEKANGMNDTDFEDYVYQIRHGKPSTAHAEGQTDYSEFDDKSTDSDDDYSYKRKKKAKRRPTPTPRGVDKIHPDDVKLWNVVLDPNSSENERNFALRRIQKNEAKRVGRVGKELRLVS